MRKVSLWGLMLIVLSLPSLVAAQGLLSLETLQVQLWPEYDQPSMLVIYEFSLPADAAFPVDVNVRIPAGSQLLAVAKDEAGNLLTIGFNGPTRDGNWDVISIAVDKATHYRVEYYAPLVKNGASRSYEFIWSGDYAVKDFELLLQQPFSSQAVTTVPPASNIAPSADGLVYHSYKLKDVLVGQDINWLISYQKDSDDLTISGMGVEAVAPLNESVDGRSNMLIENLPLILGVLGIVLILGSVIWFWLAGRSNAGRSTSRLHKRHQSKGNQAGADDGETYCSQCGKRAQASDHFCRFCGARLRRG